MAWKKGKALVWMGLSVIALTVLPLCWVAQPLLPLAPLSVGTEPIDAEMLQRHVTLLAETYKERNAARPDILASAAQSIEQEFRRIGADTHTDIYAAEGTPFRNIIARFGPAGTPSLVIGAHYDAFQHTPGADDNASGVAGLLAIASRLAADPPRHTIELVAYTLEEPPYFRTDHMGSRHHARAMAQSSKPPKLVLILEMIGFYTDKPGSQQYPFPGMAMLYPSQGNFLALVGDFASPLLIRDLKRTMRAATPLPVYSLTVPSWLPEAAKSDHISYWQENIPALMITDTAYLRNRAYHTAADTPATLDYTRMAQAVQAVLAAIRSFDTKEKTL